FQVQSTVGGLQSQFTSLGSTITLANKPGAIAIAAGTNGNPSSAISGSSVTFTWTLNGNPSYTTARVDRSTETTFTTPVSSSIGAQGTAPTFTDTALLGCTNYFLRVVNFNQGGTATAPNATQAFTTIATTPTAPVGFVSSPQSGNL